MTINKNGQVWTRMDDNGMDRHGQVWTGMDKNGQEWTRMDNIYIEF
jgi:hypothetical protein